MVGTSSVPVDGEEGLLDGVIVRRTGAQMSGGVSAPAFHRSGWNSANV